MDNIILYIKIAFAAIGGSLCSLLGGWDAWLNTLILFVVLDVVVGFIKAACGKSEKTPCGGLSSSVMFKGGLKKILIFVIVATASRLDLVISPDSVFLRSLVISYYVATEGLSIVENCGALGLPLPKKLITILENLKEKDNESNK